MKKIIFALGMLLSVNFAFAQGAIEIPEGTPNGLLYNNAGKLGNLPTAANGLLVTDINGVPSIGPAPGTGVNFVQAGSGAITRTIQEKAREIFSVGDFGASTNGDSIGSGTVSSGSNILTISSASDFRNGQGIMVVGAGPASTASAPSAISAAYTGAGGSTTYYYRLASFDDKMGMSAATASVSVSVASSRLGYVNATGSKNFVTLKLREGSGASGYAIWRSTDKTNWTFVTVWKGGDFKDYGWSYNRPLWIPTSPPAVQKPQWLITRVSAGGGTTTLTLANAAGTTQASAGIYHDNLPAFQAAVARASVAGGTIMVPCGVYEISGTISITANNVGFKGNGNCSQLRFWGVNDDFHIYSATAPSSVYGNFLHDLYISDYRKAGGWAVQADYVALFSARNLLINLPWSGMNFSKANTVSIDTVYVNEWHGRSTSGLRISSDGDYKTCCFWIKDTYLTGLARVDGSLKKKAGGIDKYGLLADGYVATVYAYNLSATEIEGHSLVLRNTVGASVGPQFWNVYGFSSEFSNDTAIHIASSRNIYFTSVNVHASWGPSAHNIVVERNSARVDFNGGMSTGAGCSGLLTAGTMVSVRGIDFYANSTPNSGGRAGACPGIIVENGSSGTVVMGNKIGTPERPMWQSAPIAIVAGADKFTVFGNVATGNVTDAISNAAGLGPTKIVSGNPGTQ